jgi:hypothetical protein
MLAQCKSTWLYEQQCKIIFACIVLHPVRLEPWRQIRARHLSDPAVRKAGIIVDGYEATYSHLTLPIEDVGHKLANSADHANAKIIAPDSLLDFLLHTWYEKYIQPREIHFKRKSDDAIFQKFSGGMFLERTGHFGKQVSRGGLLVLGRAFTMYDARRTACTNVAENEPSELDRVASALQTSSRIIRQNYGYDGLRVADTIATVRSTLMLKRKRRSQSAETDEQSQPTRRQRRRSS